MKKFIVYSYPKINLALDILGLDARAGYHKIQTVFHELRGPLFDEIEISAAEGGVLEVQCDDPRVPTDEKNTVMQAAKLLLSVIASDRRERSNLASGETDVHIFIKKRIPMLSGLGGGSSNAAAALKGLAELWGVNWCCKPKNAHESLPGQTSVAGNSASILTKPRSREIHSPACLLFKIAKKIGMDVAFFINGGTALGSHFGEKITPLPSLPPQLQFEIIETGVEISTREAYANIDLKKCGKNAKKTEKLIAAIRTGDTHGLLENMHNDFEEFIFARHPQLLKIKKQREKTGAKILLCGSGGALVAVRVH